MKSYRTVMNGTISYVRGGEGVDQGFPHRENGPAFIYPNGAIFWEKDGQYHREELPGFIDSDGSRNWYVNDELVDWKHES